MPAKSVKCFTHAFVPSTVLLPFRISATILSLILSCTPCAFPCPPMPANQKREKKDTVRLFDWIIISANFSSETSAQKRIQLIEPECRAKVGASATRWQRGKRSTWKLSAAVSNSPLMAKEIKQSRLTSRRWSHQLLAWAVYGPHRSKWANKLYVAVALQQVVTAIFRPSKRSRNYDSKRAWDDEGIWPEK